MEHQIETLTWAIEIGFGFMFALMGFMWFSICSRFDKTETNLNSKIDRVETNLNSKIDRAETNLNSRIDKLEVYINSRFDKLDEKVTDVDRRLCRLEGSFNSKDCCVLKQDQQLRKAE